MDGRGQRASPSRPRPQLRRVHGPGEAASPPEDDFLELRPGRYLMGRDVDPVEHILAEDPRVSRAHATLHVASRSYKVRIADEDSRHGTWVNGERVDEAWLEDGDVVRIGDSHFFLRFAPSPPKDAEVPALLGVSPSAQSLRHAIHQVAGHDVTVMILGASGTGKEVVARSIHDLSERSGPFIAVNCAAIPEQLAESQLFGHTAGAFTGAKSDHEGFFRAAEQGTVFLDEIGDLPLALQPKLLRAIEQRVVMPVGSTAQVAFDARIVVATHRDLDTGVADGRFRGDLYARLAQFKIPVAPLNERREDVVLLLRHALGAAAAPLDADLVDLLLAYEWPYNVRELFAVASELRVRGAGKELLTPEMVAHRLGLPPESGGTPEELRAHSSSTKRRRSSQRRPSTSPGTHRSPSSAKRTTSGSLDDKLAPKSVEEFEAIVAECNGNVRAIARATGRSRMQVYRWVEQFGVDLDQYRD